ncbi:hypothetical protein B0I35DRAFT_208744 [Stachybotrys elegans]|uniref:Myb-like DNA-binding domain-containing protein n=1 Tax=Stachybotrys elegans TaxID=80388 RepID=A0A8K0SVY8_9HYPO|nr:hypothetical protein B0I35DRAFT_208744 [Stachybotrys elegans]
MAEQAKKKEPTASEAMFFFAIVKHTKNKADIDWVAVAEEQGFKNAEVAKVRFGQVKRKLGISSDPNSSPSSVRATPTKVVKTPTKRSGTKGKGVRGKLKKEDLEDDDVFYSYLATSPSYSPIKDEEKDDSIIVGSQESQ